ncbi:hypothetical protein JQ557_31100 [Bradyrhizobium sp. U87765 SZCCT0131]|uniref:hypothetical protein n=1 Tax=unclassified Bradyrhizobium TaxID=2631580 RepID=UPI001BA5AA0C|nr:MULTISPECIES: hypothetical protein [unclassified Bradyrhizobium]MBR1222481.1 hypothetical protein [Bradyrhizobium sp. U87765 SZCCT0131]MBR1265438.1 hypothetical protein [Bradyrhizobium sp. U87765 SZCCT0134]MBR1302783.1 hypothetical protein [Bradyrhizobium sp. U87765 SZCCT0110]MBR1323481.1 hypothetical protein [Bradyrhizobium sp. U87765 SZCCT0109]MBR1346712.1 hypothetical protein [Bradyrhizobium sp. U87765 SZCCT0048]
MAGDQREKENRRRGTDDDGVLDGPLNILGTRDRKSRRCAPRPNADDANADADADASSERFGSSCRSRRNADVSMVARLQADTMDQWIVAALASHARPTSPANFIASSTTD